MQAFSHGTHVLIQGLLRVHNCTFKIGSVLICVDASQSAVQPCFPDCWMNLRIGGYLLLLNFETTTVRRWLLYRQWIPSREVSGSSFEAGTQHVPLAGHLGRDKITRRILERFYWPTVHRDVAEYCGVDTDVLSETLQSSTRREESVVSSICVF